ncbi:MAG: bifunctional glutamate N-acetyltransferase/amino-acid acetyltransferase ArgJ [Planctomycetes bacterium]|nr:bifunctional glutamate N-acetyltransferase/amino-acid acetyltransferase ArgJ [Planctomycetota bacterium]
MSKDNIQEVSGGVVAPAGFLAGACACGIKQGGCDLALLLSDRPARAAALFTTNQIVAAPVRLSRETVKRGPIRAVVVNSGNANACTGAQGLLNAMAMAEATARELGLSPSEVLVASTGIIGQPLPMEKVLAGIREAGKQIGRDAEHGRSFTRAIMTTDTSPKELALKIDTGDRTITLGGAAKGAGMIAPNMATMLAFITTDATLTKGQAKACLQRAVNRSFNQITIDGHMSTNDTVILMANGASGGPCLRGRDLTAFQEALGHLCQVLARAIVKDGEGATKFVRVVVKGAKKEKEAGVIARAIANSPLVKTAINGEDPNWGRIISAAGAAGITLDEKRLRLYIGESLIFEGGTSVVGAYCNTPPHPIQELKNIMQGKELDLRLELGLGRAEAEVWTCDLSEKYVTINARYHT